MERKLLERKQTLIAVFYNNKFCVCSDEVDVLSGEPLQGLQCWLWGISQDGAPPPLSL